MQKAITPGGLIHQMLHLTISVSGSSQQHQSMSHICKRLSKNSKVPFNTQVQYNIPTWPDFNHLGFHKHF